MWVAIGIAIAFLAGMAILLVLPVRVVFILHSMPVKRGRMRLSLLLGLLEKEFDLTRKSRDKGQSRSESTSKTSKSSKSSSVNSTKKTKQVWSTKILKHRDLGSRLIHLLMTLGRRFDFRESYCDIVFGFEDPADTGMVLGYLSALRTILYGIPEHSIRWTPDFDQEVLLCDGIIQIQFIPLEVLWDVLSFVFSKPAWRFYRDSVRF